MALFHAVVWLDHAQAHVIHFNREEHHEQMVHSKGGAQRRHHHTNAIGSGRAAPDHGYFEAIVAALSDAQEVLVTGPASAKNEFVSHVEAHAKALRPRIVAVEALDHPSDKQLLAHARDYFERTDRMRGIPTDLG